MTSLCLWFAQVIPVSILWCIMTCTCPARPTRLMFGPERFRLHRLPRVDSVERCRIMGRVRDIKSFSTMIVMGSTTPHGEAVDSAGNLLDALQIVWINDTHKNTPLPNPSKPTLEPKSSLYPRPSTSTSASITKFMANANLTINTQRTFKISKSWTLEVSHPKINHGDCHDHDHPDDEEDEAEAGTEADEHDVAEVEPGVAN
ncbi:hypothetical protein SISNIDRAFT_470965 [Sistotremastrum niveocremeum HHB9708]|uniref:Uncharacterized protein n=1 Tax=Sistotremastrum niveocremeum HHB9708 TaxID=1314777 RepID=A0A164N6D0_9AGAM|nr:hypothetical protein SISNIDRAFT_470965 [Sistotremastrum niveocremeum HHB9708]